MRYRECVVEDKRPSGVQGAYARGPAEGQAAVLQVEVTSNGTAGEGDEAPGGRRRESVGNRIFFASCLMYNWLKQFRRIQGRSLCGFSHFNNAPSCLAKSEVD